MRITEVLQHMVGGEPTTADIARHVADRISAMEQQQRIARQDGDLELLEAATSQIGLLRSEALDHHLDPNEYPGLFR